MLYPAHGAGSVCGAGMADRDFSTLGYERLNNPALQFNNKADFIQAKIRERHVKPPYFSKMEEYNLKGSPPVEPVFPPKPFQADQFEQAMQDGMLAVDIRSPEAFAGAYIPGSLAIPLEMLPVYAGEIQRRIRDEEEFILLDVRTQNEFEQGHLPNARHIFLGELPDRLQEIGSSRPITTFCGSGKRAIIAASLLKKNGFQNVEDCLGSMQACAKGVCEIVRE